MPKSLGIIFGAPNKLWLRFKLLSLKKKILVVVGVVVFLILGFNIFSNLTRKPNYTTAVVQKTNITETVTETGSIAVSGTVNVYSPTNGIVDNVYVSNGETVSEGQELATVNSSATEQEQDAAYANYLAAQNTLDTASASLYSLRSAMFDAWDTYYQLATNSTYQNGDKSPNEANRILPEFTTAQNDWLAAEANYKKQQAVIANAQAQVASTSLLYQATQNATIKAPEGGTVSNLAVTNGSSVSVNTALQPATPVLTLTSSKASEAVMSLSETDISKIKEGQKAQVKVTAVDKTFKGAVKRVDSVGTLDQGVIRYKVYVEILNPDGNLRSGMTADVTLTTHELTDALSVPNSAVKPYQGGRAVRVIGAGNTIKYVPVRIGVKGTENTQILSGLKEGQTVINVLSSEQLKRPGIFGM